MPSENLNARCGGKRDSRAQDGPHKPWNIVLVQSTPRAIYALLIDTRRDGMTTPKNSWEAHDALLEKSSVTSFDPAQDEIDARLAADAPEHPDSIELRRILQRSERSSEVATAMLLILEMCLPDGLVAPSSPKIIGLRVIALLHLLQSSRAGIGGVSMATLARKLKVTRALISHYARFWNRATGIRARGQKLAGSSESFRAGAMRGWNTRRGIPAAEDALDHQHPSEAFPQAERDSDDDDVMDSDSFVPSWQRGRGESYDDDPDLHGLSD